MIDKQDDNSAGNSLVCEWTDMDDHWFSGCQRRFEAFASTKGRFFCPGCSKPINYGSPRAILAAGSE